MNFQIRSYRGTTEEDSEITSLLNRVFVKEGYTDKLLAKKLFVPAELRKRGEIILARSSAGKLLSMAIVVHSTSLARQVGRRKIDMYSIENRIVEKWSQGRIYLHTRQIEKYGIEGILELSQFSCLPIRMVLDYSIGRLIANRNTIELMSREHVIPDSNNRKYYEQIRTVEEILDKDKAGMIFSPHVGLHENVAVLDYNDEFANIIVNQNISYERQEKVNLSLGILPQIVRSLVERRMYFRKLLRQLGDSPDATLYEKRANSIKQILVCLYGTTASYWNKYGNVLAFEEINKKSREILLKTKDIIQEQGYELVYSDTDACFLHKEGITGV